MTSYTKSQVFSDIFTVNFNAISHNVPAVYDIFASLIKETAGFQDLQKCGRSDPQDVQTPQANGRPSRSSDEA
jgi:hypothetical protein